jgi:hypothetical protein
VASLASACGGGSQTGAQSTTPAGETGGQASAGSTNASGGSGSGGEDAIALDDFAAQVAAGVAQTECAPQGSLGQCYTATPEICAAAFATAMRECTNNLRSELPPIVDMGNVDATSQALGTCAVQAFHMGLTQAGLRREVPECQGSI